MNRLGELLIEAAPGWSTLVAARGEMLRVDVAPPRLSGAPGDRFELVIDTGAPEAIVSEAVAGARLPATCPERHINGDGTFCLGLRRTPVTTGLEANAFWLTLRTYLLAQQFAERNGRWPPGRGLSHGYEAADWQLQAEAAAARCGLAADYAAALDHGAGWLARPLPDVRAVDHCSHDLPPRPGADGMIALADGCDVCAAITSFIDLEHRRREADADFTRFARMIRPCCHTMPRCPLRTDLAPADGDRP